MEIRVTPTGIPGIGALSWGTHVCQFYDGREDLADYLVPYFKTGLEHEKYCLWVTADPLSVEDAQMLLRAAVPDLDTRAGRGQIEFVDYRNTSRMSSSSSMTRMVALVSRSFPDGEVVILTNLLANAFTHARGTPIEMVVEDHGSPRCWTRPAFAW